MPGTHSWSERNPWRWSAWTEPMALASTLDAQTQKDRGVQLKAAKWRGTKIFPKASMAAQWIRENMKSKQVFQPLEQRQSGRPGKHGLDKIGPGREGAHCKDDLDFGGDSSLPPMPKQHKTPFLRMYSGYTRSWGDRYEAYTTTDIHTKWLCKEAQTIPIPVGARIFCGVCLR